MNNNKTAAALYSIFLLLTSCGTVGDLSRPDFIMRPDGLHIHPQTGQPYSGTFDYSNQGSRFKGSIVNGRREGLFSEWYPGGQKKVEYNYRNNRKHGRARSWFTSGQLRTDITFENDQLMRGITYQLDGREASRLEKGTGTLTAYHNNGKPSWEKTYQDGKRIRQRIWHTDGILKAED